MRITLITALLLAAVANAENPCRTDLTQARADAARWGVPVALFVGGADDAEVGRAVKAGMIPVALDTFSGDDMGSTKRVVVMTPDNTSPTGFVRTTTTTLAPTVPQVPVAPPPVVPVAPQRGGVQFGFGVRGPFGGVVQLDGCVGNR